jgi:Family of unknown function (DUF6292)
MNCASRRNHVARPERRPVMCTGIGRPELDPPSPPRIVADYVASIRDSSAPPGGPVTPTTAAAVSGGLPADPSGTPTALLQAISRHPSALGRHLDNYLASVARELRDSGVITGAPQRSDPTERLIGSIVLDCTALRLAAWAPHDPTAGTRSLGGALHPERAAPVVVTWDEATGWCVGLHHDPTHSSRRYLHPELLPAARAVADFVVGLALGQPLGAAHPYRRGRARPPTTPPRAVRPTPP